MKEMWATLALFREPRMARMALIFFYTGFNQPYQLVTFGDRFFTPQTLGLMLAVFYFFELVGAWASARLVDDARRPLKARAVRAYAVFFVVTTVGNLFAMALEAPLLEDDHENNNDDDENRINRASAETVVLGALAMAAWGFSDSQIQAISYWHLGVTYRSGADQARGVGFFKFVQSAGWCAGFALSPTDRLPAFWQLTLTVVCYVLGLVFIEMPGGSAGNGGGGGGGSGGSGGVGSALLDGKHRGGRSGSDMDAMSASPLVPGGDESEYEQPGRV